MAEPLLAFPRDQRLPESEDERCLQWLVVRQGEKSLTPDHVAGPDNIKAISRVLWCYAVLNVVCTYWCSYAARPFCCYPWWLWLGFLGVFVQAMLLELRAFRLVVIPFDKLLNPGCRSFTTRWKWAMTFVSGVSKLDLVAQGFFIATTVKTMISGTDAEVIYEAWLRSVGSSPFLNWVSGASSLMTVIVFVMLLQLLQPFWAALHSMPRGELDYCLCAKPSVVEVRAPRWHADALMHMAYAGRMLLITDKHTEWIVQSAMELRSEGTPGKLDMLEREVRRMSMRIWLSTILERGLMLEVQCTVFAISRMLRPPGPPRWGSNMQLLLSITISFITFVHAVVNHVGQGLKVQEAFRQLPQRLAKAMVYKWSDTVKNEGTYQKSYQWVQSTLFLYQAGVIAVFVLLLHSCATIVAAFGCPHGVWNIPTGMPGTNELGCVKGLEPLIPTF